MKTYKSKLTRKSSSATEDPSLEVVELLRVLIRQECARSIADRLPVVPVNPSAIAVAATSIKLTRASKEILESVHVAAEFIAAVGKPLGLDTLFSHARGAGVQIATPDPKSTYGARLRDHGTRFGLFHLKNFGWWIMDRPYSPASYFPSTPAAPVVPAGDRVPLPSRLKRK